MLIEVEWTWLEDDDNPLWRDRFCLYAYFHLTHNWLLYLGKADFANVRQRTHGEHKERLFYEIGRAYGTDELRAMHGELILPDGRRRTSELLSDVETLLIMRRQPRWNQQARRSRIMRPGLRVHCMGDWPFSQFRYHDT